MPSTADFVIFLGKIGEQSIVIAGNLINFYYFFMGRNEKNEAQKKSLCALFSILLYFERKSKMNQKVHQVKQIKRG